MKTPILIKTFLILFTAFSLLACDNDDDDQAILSSELPQRALIFIETHFPDSEIVSVTLDRNDPRGYYEVKLDNNFDLDFDQEGNWTEVEGHGQKVPDAIIPDPILTYVETNYPEAFIEEISKKTDRYEVDLSNDIDLIFDLEGNLISVDPLL